MAITTCVKCGGHTYEVREFEPVDGRYKQNFVQCTGCGVPVGVLDYFNLGAKLQNVEQSVVRIGALITKIEQRLTQIEQILRR